MKQDEVSEFKRATCRGSYALGTACGTCERCRWELSRQPRPTAEQEQSGNAAQNLGVPSDANLAAQLRDVLRDGFMIGHSHGPSKDYQVQLKFRTLKKSQQCHTLLLAISDPDTRESLMRQGLISVEALSGSQPSPVVVSAFPDSESSVSTSPAEVWDQAIAIAMTQIVFSSGDANAAKDAIVHALEAARDRSPLPTAELDEASPRARLVVARGIVEKWREANDWPGLVWSPQNLSDEPRWMAAWRDLESRIAAALTVLPDQDEQKKN